MWKIVLLIVLFIILGGMFTYQYILSHNIISNNKNDLQILQNNGTIIYVTDQQAGSSVLIDYVSMISEGYVVIYDNNNGKPGNIIGNSKFLSKGESRNIAIGLIRPTVKGEFLFAMLHGDNGDQAFYPNIDIPLRDQDGNTMYTYFLINQDSSSANDFGL